MFHCHLVLVNVLNQLERHLLILLGQELSPSIFLRLLRWIMTSTVDILLFCQGVCDLDDHVDCPSIAMLPIVGVEDVCHSSMKGKMVLIDNFVVAHLVLFVDLELCEASRSVEPVDDS